MKTNIQMPFSVRLNEWIMNRVKNLPYTVAETNVTNLNGLNAVFSRWKKLPVSGEHCENNIFGSEEVNIAARAWHDYKHLELQAEFDLAGETKVAFAQAAELPYDWYYEKYLILIDVIGQTLYHDINNHFVVNQREFANKVMGSGI